LIKIWWEWWLTVTANISFLGVCTLLIAGCFVQQDEKSGVQ
jgi:hypothetical protein